MHQIEPFHRWTKFYDSSRDERSPFFGKTYNYELYSETIYGYYIDPAWDYMGSETLYVKLLYCDYNEGVCIMQLIGEWNDAINNDIMQLKRNIIDIQVMDGISRFILLGENVFNFHGSDDSYYEEWFEDVEDGWVACVGFEDHVIDEMQNFNIDNYLNLGGSLQVNNWRIMTPQKFIALIESLIVRRVGA